MAQNPRSEIVALAVPIYESVKAKPFRAIQALTAEMARATHAELWLLEPAQERLTYPFCVAAMLEALYGREKAEGRVDWLLWLEDDIVPPPGLYATLRAAADPVERPYMAALAHCRAKPFWPGVAMHHWHIKESLMEVAQWQMAPDEGVHAVDQAGMCAALIHRSLLGRVREPQFSVLVSENTSMGPDAYWSMRLRQIGVQPYVCCDVEVGHLAPPPVINRALSIAFNEGLRNAK